MGKKEYALETRRPTGGDQRRRRQEEACSPGSASGRPPSLRTAVTSSSVRPRVDRARRRRREASTGEVQPSRSEVVSRSPSSRDRKSTRLNSSHLVISYAVFCLKKKKKKKNKKKKKKMNKKYLQ